MDTSGGPVDNTIRPQPEVGEPLSRRRFTGEMDDFSGRFTFRTRQELAAFITFYRDDLEDGSLRFDFKHPITGADVEVMFMAPPRWSRNGVRSWSAAVQLRTMP